jgi:hypothetical protein
MSEDIAEKLSKNGTKWVYGEDYYCSAPEDSTEMFYVYRHFCPDSGKCYVGYAANPNYRWSAHVSESACEKSAVYNTKFKKAIRSHGKDAFLHEIMCVVPSDKDARLEEIRLISKYDSYRMGYNSTLGGEGYMIGDPITEDMIAELVSAYQTEHGKFPTVRATSEWCALDGVLRQGGRGLPGGSSLAKLMADRFGYVYWGNKMPLSDEFILDMVDQFKNEHGKFPGQYSGLVAGGFPGDDWGGYNASLRDGGRGLHGGTTLAKLIHSRYPEYVHSKNCENLTVEFIVDRAKEHLDLNGKFPVVKGGSVTNGYPGDTWNGYDRALFEGGRGLPGGTTLKRLLAKELGAPNHMDKPALTEEYIVELAKQHKERTGKRPSCKSGAVIGGHHGDTWNGYQQVLQTGGRELPGGSSLSKLLNARGVR